MFLGIVVKCSLMRGILSADTFKSGMYTRWRVVEMSVECREERELFLDLNSLSA